MNKVSWKGSVVDEMSQSRGVLQEETKKMIEFINKNQNSIVKLKFPNTDTAKVAFNRLRYAKERENIKCHRISRQDNNLYVDMK